MSEARGFPPFVAQRRSTRGRSWWAQAWVQALEDTSLDSDQLRRGRRYANSGQVGTITASPGRIAATVYAPEDTYEAVVQVDELTADDWWRFLDQVAARAGHIAALLDGEMPHDLVAAAADAGVTLLPGIGDLDPSCTCDAWELPCQHAAALCYQTAWLLDADPFVLLLLRGRSREILLDQLQTWTHSTHNRTTSADAPATASPTGPAPRPAQDAGSASTQPSAKPPAVPTPTVGSRAAGAKSTTTASGSAASAAGSATTGAAPDVTGAGLSPSVGESAGPGAGSTAEGDAPAAPVGRSAMPRAGSAVPGAGPEATSAGSAASVERPAVPGASSAVPSAGPEATSAQSEASVDGSAAPGAGSAVPGAGPETTSAGSGVLEAGSAAPGAGSTVSAAGPEATSAGSGASVGGSAVPGAGSAASGAGYAVSGDRPAARGGEAAESVAGSASGEALSSGVSVADVFAGEVGELPPLPELPARVEVEQLAVSGIEAPEGLGPAVLQLLVLDASRRARRLLSALLNATPEPEPLDEWQDAVRLAADFPELTTPLAEVTGQAEDLALGIQA